MFQPFFSRILPLLLFAAAPAVAERVDAPVDQNENADEVEYPTDEAALAEFLTRLQLRRDALQQQLLAQPSNRERMHALVKAEWAIADYYEHINEYQRGEPNVRTALELLERLFASDPLNNDWFDSLIVTYDTLALMQWSESSNAASLKHSIAALNAAKLRLSLQPSSLPFQTTVIDLQFEVAREQSNAGDERAALQTLLERLQALETLIASGAQGSEPSFDHAELAQNLQHIAATYEELGQPDKAIDYYDREFDLIVRRAAEAPQLLRDLVPEAFENRQSVAFIYGEQGQLEQAISAWQRALDWAERAPESAYFENMRSTMTAIGLVNVGTLKLELGDTTAGLADLGSAKQIFETLRDSRDPNLRQTAIMSVQAIDELLAEQQTAND